jgi:sulfur-oxidizing protein SoxX
MCPSFRRFIVGLVILTLSPVSFGADSKKERLVDPEVPGNWVFTMPQGDPVAGEKAFAKMQCYSCHKVTGKTFEGQETKSEGIGPEFTPGYAKLPAGYLAESIINFNRFISHANFRISYMSLDAFKPAGREDYPGGSRMANYNEIMTVQELIDIVAFLKSLDKQTSK